MRGSIMAGALVLTSLAMPEGVLAACQEGVASAPYIGAADMQAMDRAAKSLPQYKGYSAFRAGRDLMIVDPRGIVSYMMPLRGSANPANCP